MASLNLTTMQQSNIHCVAILISIILSFCIANAETHYHQFVVEATPVKRLCRTHNIITVNGQFPGPTLEARDGDTLVIKVINSARYNVTLHWHGIRQMRTPWADGPEYVTQCPIQPGSSYTYRFNIENQDGTLWWHAHSRWLRATVYGALIIYPKLGVPYPFPKPKQEIPIILETTKFHVKSGDTVLLRIINAALNQELFFTVANHMLTVVGNDAAYNKQFTTRVIMLGPGQTTNVLLTANQPAGRYYMATRAYNTAQNAAFDNTTATAILEYDTKITSNPLLPQLPAFNDTATVTAFTSQLRSLSTKNAKVPIRIDENLFFTVGLGLVNCTRPGPRCQGPNNNTRFAASMNNVSFVLPRRTSLLQAYYQNIQGIYTTDFPPVPPVTFDYTGNVSRGLWQPRFGTKLYKLKFGSNVQIVLQDTAIVTTEDHPIHLHGYHFYVVGQGFGNFNPSRDTAKFNLIDPPVRNTINVPVGGWSVIRFVADNPGMAFLVENGHGKLQTVEAPPPDLPPC
ncbi:hypothetical protein DH2020_022052 [Rehmannia glutinosa]|uniref:Laccase n=1 Tax=Rehmannia glutinosa TaxID=99300 RepID=A0ABR0WC79_REHGL